MNFIQLCILYPTGYTSAMKIKPLKRHHSEPPENEPLSIPAHIGLAALAAGVSGATCRLVSGLISPIGFLIASIGINAGIALAIIAAVWAVVVFVLDQITLNCAKSFN